MKLLYRVLTSLIIMVVLASCQEDTIEPDVFGAVFGEVLTDSDNIAIENATVSTNPPTNIVLTDEMGRFSFENIKTGTYTIRAEKEGYIPQIESVTVLEDQDASVVVKMQPDSEVNTAPDNPQLVQPMKGSQNQPLTLTLEWTALDSDENNTLLFDIWMFTTNQNFSTLVASDLTEPLFELSDLEYNTTYFWQVVVKDGIADPVNGDIWNFKTEEFPDHRFLYTKEAGGKYDIYSANVANQGFLLTSNAGSNWRPRMSPDRTHIAFLANLGIDAHLFIMDRDGSNMQQVTSTIPVAGFNNFDLDFAWSPNGQELLYMNHNKLYRININGSGLTFVVEAPIGKTFTECDWTAQGNRIVARTTGLNSYNSTILLYNLDGSLLQEVMPDVPGSTGGGVFSIDGNYVLYTQDVSEFESPDGRQLDAHIFLQNLNTQEVIDLSEFKTAGTNDLDPRFSPDGSKVIFTNTNNDGISPKFIYIMTLTGEGRTLLFEDAEMGDWR